MGVRPCRAFIGHFQDIVVFPSGCFVEEMIVARTSMLVEGGGDKFLCSGYILKIEQIEFAAGLNVGMREGLRVTSLTSSKVFFVLFF